VEELIPVLQPERARGDEFIEELRSLEPEISVVIAYGQILTSEVLAVPKRGSVNIHASLLPELRGAAPVQWAIIRGYETTGVTIMQMGPGLDSGPVLLQVPEPIRADETGSELAGRLAEIGAEAVIEALALMENSELKATHQDESAATYAPKLSREMARLDWKLPAIEVARWIRGLDAVPGAWSSCEDGSTVKLFNPRIEIREGVPGEVIDVEVEVGCLIACGEHAVRVREVQPSGKRRMTATEWIRGRGVVPGARLS
jgi:methionyl-tRNA formyltransferase